jgi:FAM210A/B-like domain
MHALSPSFRLPPAVNALRKPLPLNPRHAIRPPRRRFYAVDAKPSGPLKPPSSPSPSLSPEDPKLPVTQRLKILFKKYRWPALAVYLGLGAVDFGIAFIAVRAFGTERIGRYEKIILQKFEDTFGWKTKGTPPEYMTEGTEDGASIWTEIALAYTIHKTLFALIRVPVTVAITPALVRWYQRKGYGALLAQIPAIGRFFQSTPTAAGVRK